MSKNKTDKKYLILCGVIVILAAMVGVYVYNYGFTFSSSDAAGYVAPVPLLHQDGGSWQRLVVGEKIRIKYPSPGYRVPVAIKVVSSGDGVHHEPIVYNWGKRYYDWTVYPRHGTQYHPIAGNTYRIEVFRINTETQQTELEPYALSEPFTIDTADY